MGARNGRFKMWLSGRPLGLSSKLLSELIHHFQRATIIGFSGVALFILSLPAQGGPIVANGDFETTTGNTSSFVMSAGTAPFAPDSWTFSGGIGCVVFPSSTTSQTNACGSSFASLYPGWTLSPDGGNFVAIDGDPSFAGSLSQTISVVAGQSYQVSFDQAAEQFQFFSGATTEQWLVSLGGQSQDSALMHNASHGFVAWMGQSLTFTATTTGSEVLSFFAVGTPGGEPPVVLLDSVSVTAVPEPETYTFIGIWLLGAFAVRRQLKKRG
jgi:hypothetical protein